MSKGDVSLHDDIMTYEITCMMSIGYVLYVQVTFGAHQILTRDVSLLHTCQLVGQPNRHSDEIARAGEYPGGHGHKTVLDVLQRPNLRAGSKAPCTHLLVTATSKTFNDVFFVHRFCRITQYLCLVSLQRTFC